jgi:hypothetical protein
MYVNFITVNFEHNCLIKLKKWLFLNFKLKKKKKKMFLKTKKTKIFLGSLGPSHSHSRSINTATVNYKTILDNRKEELFGLNDIICCFKLKIQQILAGESIGDVFKKYDYVDLIASTHFYENSFFDSIGLGESFILDDKENYIENDEETLKIKKKIDNNMSGITKTYFVVLVHYTTKAGDLPEYLIQNNKRIGFEKMIIYNTNYLELLSSTLIIDIINRKDITPIFIFKNCTWMEVLFQFYTFNYRVSGGSNTKRHILSPLQYQLFQFLNFVDPFIESHIIKSFHLGNMFTKQSILDFKKYLDKDYDKITNDELDYYIKRTNEILDRIDYILQFRKNNFTLQVLTDRIRELNFKPKDLPSSARFLNTIQIHWRWYESSVKALNNDLLKEFINLKKTLDLIDDRRNKENESKEKRKIEDNENNINLNEKNKNINDKTKFIGKNKKGKVSPFKGKNGRSYHTSIQYKNYSKQSVENEEKGNELVLVKDIKEYSEIASKSTDKKHINNNIKGNESIYKFMFFVGEVIKNCDNNYEKAQAEIEDGWLNYVKDKINKDKSKIRKNFKYIINTANETLELKSKIIKRKFPKAFDKFNIDLLIIAFSTIFTHHINLGFNSIALIISNNILFYWYKKDVLKKKDLINDNYVSIQEYSENLGIYNKVDKLKLGSFFIDIFCSQPTNVFERSYKNIDPIQANDNNSFDVEDKDNTDLLVDLYDDELYSLAVLVLNEDYAENLNEFIINYVSLPMIWKPLEWDEQIYGGFLINSIEKKDLIRGSEIHKHVIDNRKNLYSAVNYLNRVKFKINNILLNYLDNEGKYLWDNYIKSIKNKSGILHSNITIEIAKSYSNVSSPIYLNVFADWRSRIYTHSFYISYQGGDLANSLLQFYDGYPLTKSGKYFLYIFGANCYNYKNISKSSYDNRVKWVEKNYNKIINLEPDFILKAESKFLFTAFCLTMRELYNNPNANVNLPVFLDATCSGIQHLSALLLDFETGKKVNLTPQTNNDNVQDLYADLVGPINKAINKYGENNKEYHKFVDIKLGRDHLKPPIMTKVYNVTLIGVVNQLKSKFNKIKTKGKNTQYLVPTKENKEISLNYQEVFILASIINDQIFELLPSLKGIFQYFKNTIRLMLRLNIPIVWFTPSGLKLTQYYSLSKPHKVSISFAKSSKTVVLRESLNKLDKNKQINAIIPNIIHSLDASHLINLLNKALITNFEPVISVHDCFGTHPNKLEDLILLVKKEFILIYTKSNFLEMFHSKLIQSIKDNQYAIITDNEGFEYITIKHKIIKIPNIPDLGKLNIEDIINSHYIIT